MKPALDPHLRRDLIKLCCLFTALAATTALFIISPSLSSPTLISLVTTAVLSPWVSALERRGYTRALSIFFIFLLLFAGSMIVGTLLISLQFHRIPHGTSGWILFKTETSEYFHNALEKLRSLEVEIKSHYPFLDSLHPTKTLLVWGQQIGTWFVEHGPELMGILFSWILTIPILTFVLLNEGRAIRRGFFHLVPNRYFESFFLISTEITNSISDYIQAKLIEALLVGIMVAIGLALIHVPYSIFFGIIAGITNIVPYIGPFIGAIPALLTAALDPDPSAMILYTSLVFIFANLVDLFLIFPLVVAKLVKLHPLILIAVAAVGEQYYGFIGILLSVPVATAIKVIIQEIYLAVYEQKSSSRRALPSAGNEPVLDREN